MVLEYLGFLCSIGTFFAVCVMTFQTYKRVKVMRDIADAQAEFHRIIETRQYGMERRMRKLERIFKDV